MFEYTDSIYWIYRIAKFFHYAGLAAAVGITIGLLLLLMTRSTLTGVRLHIVHWISLAGFGFAVAAGITMMWTVNWDFATDLWFKIKTGCLLVALASGFTIGRATFKQSKIADRKRHATAYLLIQVFLYGVTIVVSVFRFR